MQFTSLAFAVFLPIVFLIYWAVPNKYRAFFLLLVSYGFYMTFSAGYVLLLFAMSLLSYFIGLHCSKKSFIAGVMIQVGALAFFKYAGFLPGVSDSFIIPVGISFYLFKSISYMADVYKGKLLPEKEPVTFFLYLAFFPDIVSGPINRAETLIPQFKEEKTFEDLKEKVEFVMKQYEGECYSFEEYSFEPLECMVCRYYGYLPRVKME